MSRQLITEYRSELDRIHAASGSKRESVVREAFKDLLKGWARRKDLQFVAQELEASNLLFDHTQVARCDFVHLGALAVRPPRQGQH